MAGVTAMSSVLSSIAKSSLVTVGLMDEHSTNSSWGCAPSPDAVRTPSNVKTATATARAFQTLALLGVGQIGTSLLLMNQLTKALAAAAARILLQIRVY